jgi:putative tricarboxylic transport membrane protein
VARAQKISVGIRDPRQLGSRALIRLLIILAVIWGSVIYTSRTGYPDLTWLRVAITGLVLLGTLIVARAPRDFFGGLALVGLALVAIWAASDLSGMHGFAFGPGTAPRLFASLLIAVGIGVAAVGVLLDGPEIDRYAIRGPVLVVLAIVGFAMMIRPLGLIVASYVTFMVAISASREMRMIESLIAAAAMTAFCVFLFSYILQLPFQLKPAFML